jgi:hypothetical protein
MKIKDVMEWMQLADEDLYSARILDLFTNPVGCLTSLAVFQAKALQNCGF